MATKSGKDYRSLVKLAALMIPVLLAGGCSGDGGPAGGKSGVPKKVVVETVADSGLKKAGIAAGRVTGETEVQVLAQVSGRVWQVHAEIGQTVTAGEPLVVLDDRDFRAGLALSEANLKGAQARLAEAVNGARPQQRLQAAERVRAAAAAFEQARKQGERLQVLHKAGAVSPVQVEAAELAVTQAGAAHEQAIQDESLINEGSTPEVLANLQAGVEQQEAALAAAGLALENAVIAAPATGRVAGRQVNPGEMAAPGKVLMTVVSQDPLVEVNVPAADIDLVAVGQALPVCLDRFAGGMLTGRVIAVSPQADPVNKEYPVKLRLPGELPGWTSGLYAEVILPASADRPVVSREAVVKRGGEYLVFVAADNRVTARPVVTGHTDGTRWEILKGLHPGEKVVIVGQDALQDGESVVVLAERGPQE
ncbi:MAG: efflux RND transporter periplasmic adaptor subunit [Heliobacteriaceae bacterium]|nr:efflux RND transporter periplasmic adaptor subunit [Heliobacteriaceae bacterium]